MSWKEELSLLKNNALAGPAPELPAPVLEWFDLNRARNCAPPADDIEMARPTAAYMTGLSDRIRAIAGEFQFLHDWGGLHTDAYGWRVLMQRHVRDGVAHFLLCAIRDDKPSTRDEKMLDKMLAYLGCNAEDDFLMSTRGEDDPDVQDYWTWPQDRAS